MRYALWIGGALTVGLFFAWRGHLPIALMAWFLAIVFFAGMIAERRNG